MTLTALLAVLILQLPPGPAATRAEADAQAARDAVAAVEVAPKEDVATCVQATTAERRIVAAAVRLERDGPDPDLAAAWQAIERIRERACPGGSVAPQADGIDPLD
jgi:hypothetical protein